MFLENTVNHKEQFGWIEVICGSMFSGKTEELIRRLKRAQFARQKVEIFKPTVDVRYDDDKVVSHDANEIRSTAVPAAANIPILADGCDVVGIDEAQFFDDEIVRVCNDLANSGIRVIVAGLVPNDNYQLNLFSHENPKHKPLMSAIDGLNKKYKADNKILMKQIDRLTKEVITP